MIVYTHISKLLGDHHWFQYFHIMEHHLRSEPLKVVVALSTEKTWMASLEQMVKFGHKSHPVLLRYFSIFFLESCGTLTLRCQWVEYLSLSVSFLSWSYRLALQSQGRNRPFRRMIPHNYFRHLSSDGMNHPLEVLLCLSIKEKSQMIGLKQVTNSSAAKYSCD